MAHEFGVRLGLIAFATAALQAVCWGTAFDPALRTAGICFGLFYGLGALTGEIARRVVEEQFQAEIAHQPVATHPPA